jgi:hypothetical protein
LREISRHDADEQQSLLVMRHMHGLVGHLGHQRGVVGQDVTVERGDAVGELVAEDQAAGFPLIRNPGRRRNWGWRAMLVFTGDGAISRR